MHSISKATPKKVGHNDPCPCGSGKKYKAATCETKGETTYTSAAFENEAFAVQTKTLEDVGWNAYDTCKRCDYTTYEEIAALGHDLEHHDAKATTCTAIGCARARRNNLNASPRHVGGD